MKESAKSLADLFASFRIEEQARREQFMQNELKQLPFQLASKSHYRYHFNKILIN